MSVYGYSTEQYPFRSVAEDILGECPDTLSPVGYDSVFSVAGDQSTHYHKRWYADGWPQTHFHLIYRRFVREVVEPIMGEPVVYQSIPTFRVHLPGNVAVGEYHTDQEYGHSDGEVNIWVPLTCAWDTNTIHFLDAEQNKYGVDMQYGQFLLFDGVSIPHGNEVNSTGFTRVSFDFRVISQAVYKDREEQSISHGVKFKLGAYWSNV